MEADNCIDVLKVGVKNYPTPQIINSDQGSQFTGHDRINELKKIDIQISMAKEDGLIMLGLRDSGERLNKSRSTSIPQIVWKS
jgi:hypothetical protein